MKFNEVNYSPAFTQEYDANQVFPFDQAFFMILNLAIGGTLGGAVDDSIFPTAFEVDYVRIYQKDYSSIDKKVPEMVEGITAQQKQNSIFWKKGVDDTDVKRYAIYVDGIFREYTNLNQYSFTNLVPQQSYSITIEAEDFTGRVSQMSNPYSLTAR